MKRDIMFVCTGNTCRSPIAEGLAKAILTDERTILSRGIAVAYEDNANVKAVEVMKERNIDISAHRSKQFDPSDVTDEMTILTMTLRHKLFLESQYPGCSSQVMTLLEYLGEDGDIVDPYGCDITYYKACAAQIEQLIGRIAEKEENY